MYIFFEKICFSKKIWLSLHHHYKLMSMKNQEKLFKEKAKTYLVCFHDRCPRHEHCLRWLVGRHVDPSVSIATCVSPLYAPAVEGRCDQYRNDQPVRMPVGMSQHFYHDMPAHIALSIRKALIAHNCRSTYYHYHSGRRPITPDYEALVRQVCQQFGWTQPLRFDGEVEDYVW